MTTVGFIIVLATGLMQLYLGYRINNLYWKDIYRSVRKASLSRLKEAFNNARTIEDQNYVRKTIYVYYGVIILFCAFVLSLLFVIF